MGVRFPHALLYIELNLHIAKIYEVSDKAVEKWCKKYNIEKPPRGYWTNKTYAS